MSTFRIKIFLFAVSFAIISCKRTYYSPREIIANTEVPTMLINFEETNIECAGLSSILAVDSMVVTFSSNKEAMIQVFDYSGNQISRLCPAGRAKNEYLMVDYAGQSMKINEDRYLYLIDNMKNEYSLYNLSGSIRKGSNEMPKILRKKEDFVNNVFFRKDDSYFTYKTLSYDDPRDMIFYPPEYTLVYPNGKKKKFDIIPNVLYFSQKAVFPAQFFHSMVRMSEDGNKVVAVSSYEDRMTFINLETNDCFGLRCKDFVDITKYADESIETISKDCKEGVDQVVVSDDYIFVLYDNRTIYEVEELESPKISTIRVYNWDGVYLAELSSNVPLFDITVDFDSKVIIGVDYYDDEKIYMADFSTCLDEISKISPTVNNPV